MLDLLLDDRGQVVAFLDIVVIREGLVGRHGEDLLIAARLVSSSSTAIGRARTTEPGMKGERATTRQSSGSPSSQSVCGMNRNWPDSASRCAECDRRRSRPTSCRTRISQARRRRDFDDDVDVVRRVLAHRDEIDVHVSPFDSTDPLILRRD
jgi:hypothetical protein